MNPQFTKGVRHGFPIFLGYVSVSFGFGILSVNNGLSVLTAAFISATNLTSAGQTAGVLAIASGVTVLETVLHLILTQLVINVRYSLMAISLSQKTAPSFTMRHRILAAFGITDEVFAVAYSQPTLVTPAYMYGLIAISWLGWVTGTTLGALIGNVLPTEIRNAMGILLYGMFIAIVVPPARKERKILFVVVLAALLSCVGYYALPMIESSITVIVSAVVAAAVGAWFFPVKGAIEEC